MGARGRDVEVRGRAVGRGWSEKEVGGIGRAMPFLFKPSRPSSSKCPPGPIVSGVRALDFAAFATGLLTLILNINNNVNNNNNNVNNQNLNVVESSNTAASFNTNTANQINIMPGAGRRLKRQRQGGKRKLLRRSSRHHGPGLFFLYTNRVVFAI